MPSSDQTRLLIVEDVPQVAQYIRGLLNAQAQVKLLDVLSEGGKALGQIQELRPDVVLVDALLQGRVKGPKLVEQIHEAGLGVPVIVLTVPQNPIEPDPSIGIHGVLSMPFSGFDLMTRIASARKEFEALQEKAGTRVFSVFAPKGGVGKTTIAFNLAVALGQLDQRTVLIDGSLQFGDLRGPAQGADRRAVDPRPADRPDRRVRPGRRPVARPVGHRHPARAAAHRDGRDGHVARRREGPLAPPAGSIR